MGGGATRRGTRLRGPFTCLLISISIIFFLSITFLCLETFSDWSNLYLPKFAQTPCNCSKSIQSNLKESIDPRPSQPFSVPACPPAQERIVEKFVEKIVVEEKFVEKIVNSGPVFEQWWAEGKEWHNPGMFPLCSMDACFNFSSCANTEELLVFHYDIPSPPVRYFTSLNTTAWSTSDPAKACLFFVFEDLDSPWKPHPNSLPFWNNGMNHVLISFSDLWGPSNPSGNTIENASILSSALHETTFRPGFDIGIPLPGRSHLVHLQSLRPFERKYFLTFRGTRYLGRSGEGTFRSHADFRGMFNSGDVIVVTTCSHGINDMLRKEDPELGENCDEDEENFQKYEFDDLMNSTFSLAPAGRSGSSYRFIEVLSAGAIPVIIADNHVKPFENLIQWPRCALQFPTSEMHRVVAALRGMSAKEVEERQKYCLWVYRNFLNDDETLLGTVMRALKARFYGAFAEFSDVATIYSRDRDLELEKGR